MSLSKKQKYNGTIWIPIFKETGLQNLDIENDKFKLKEMFIKYFYENLKTYYKNRELGTNNAKYIKLDENSIVIKDFIKKKTKRINYEDVDLFEENGIEVKAGYRFYTAIEGFSCIEADFEIYIDFGEYNFIEFFIKQVQSGNINYKDDCGKKELIRGDNVADSNLAEFLFYCQPNNDEIKKVIKYYRDMFEETYINIYQNNKKHPGFQTIGNLIYYQMSSLEKSIKLKQLGFKQSLIKFITKNNFVSLNYWFNIVTYSLDYYVDEHFNKTKPSIPSILYINKFVQKEIKERFIYSFYINDLKVKMVVGSEV